MKMIQHICGLKLVSDAFKNIIYCFFRSIIRLKDNYSFKDNDQLFKINLKV